MLPPIFVIDMVRFGHVTLSCKGPIGIVQVVFPLFSFSIHLLFCFVYLFVEKGYDLMGFELSKPRLRAELEADLKR